MGIQIVGRRGPYLGKNVRDSHVETLHYCVNPMSADVKSGEKLTIHAPPTAIA